MCFLYDISREKVIIIQYVSFTFLTRFLLNTHSCFRSIKPLLDKYHMKAEVISKENFMHSAHSEGICSIITIDAFKETYEDKELTSFDDIHLIKITLQ